MKSRYLLFAATTAAALIGTSSGAAADEVATLVNRSSYTVQFYLTWGGIRESPVITLRPGGVYKTGGRDGNQLFVRFNSMPGSPRPVDLKVRLQTLRTTPRAAGWISSFRNAGPGRVLLFSK